MDISDAVLSFFEWFANIPDFIIAVIYTIFTSLFELLKDLFFWIVDTLLTFAISLVGELDFSAVTQYLDSFGDLPAEIINILGLIGIGEAFAIIGAAILIRFLLQLIPFVRLGS